MIVKQAEFVTSVATTDRLPKSDLPMVAFAGRSNVGKSSLLNCITSSKGLAKTSSMPGRTRLINFFLINKSIHFVDLPGYGYAIAGKENKENWAVLLESFLRDCQQISLVLLLVDIRHEPTEQDKQMMRFMFHYGLPFKVVATKADKLPKSKISAYVRVISNALALGKADIIPFSIETKMGKEEVLAQIEKFCAMKKEASDDFDTDDTDVSDAILEDVEGMPEFDDAPDFDGDIGE